MSLVIAIGVMIGAAWKWIGALERPTSPCLPLPIARVHDNRADITQALRRSSR